MSTDKALCELMEDVPDWLNSAMVSVKSPERIWKFLVQGYTTLLRGTKLGKKKFKMEIGPFDRLGNTVVTQDFVGKHQKLFIQIAIRAIAVMSDYFGTAGSIIKWDSGDPNLKRICSVYNLEINKTVRETIDQWVHGNIYDVMMAILLNNTNLKVTNFTVSDVTISEGKMAFLVSFKLKNEYGLNETTLQNYMDTLRSLEASIDRDEIVRLEAALNDMRLQKPTIDLVAHQFAQMNMKRVVSNVDAHVSAGFTDRCVFHL